MKNISTNSFTTLLLLVVLCIVAEGLLFGNGVSIFAVIGILAIYFAFKRRRKALFWFGVIAVLIALFSMWSLRLLLVVTLVYILWRLRKGDPIQISLNSTKNTDSENIVKNKNQLFQFEDHVGESYAWKDIHLQSLVGELVIDTTETILPKGTSFISVRQGFGKTTIYIPYEIPVRIHYNAIAGEAKIINQEHPRLWNEGLSVRDGYSDTTPSQELIISVSSLFGNLEVIRK